jgi:hypothetical protein
MLAPFHPAQIEMLAQALAADGVAPHEARLRAAAELAGRRGADPLFVAVASDCTEPEVARLRAFGRLAAWLRSDAPVAVRPLVLDRCA